MLFAVFWRYFNQKYLIMHNSDSTDWIFVDLALFYSLHFVLLF